MQPGKPRAMQMDIERYRSYVDRFDMPEDQKIAVLTHVWSIMESFVDRAFGHAPEQQLRLGTFGSQRGGTAISCAKEIKDLPGESVDGLDSTEALTPEYNDAAAYPPAGKRRR
jgi:hypothetical protein